MRRMRKRWAIKAGVAAIAGLMVSGLAGATVATAAPNGGYQELFVPSGMGPIKVQVQWAARGGDAALYVLDGLRAPADHSQWLSDTNVLQRFAGDNVTLVFPVGGQSSFYSDWYRPSSTNGQRTTYKWETFLTQELPAFLSGFGVSRTNNGIVGLSMGGNAALVLAAHHRDQFRFAGSFSGFVNPTFPAWNLAMRVAMLDAGGFNIDDMWGPATDPAWARNDAVVQAPLLRGLPMYIASGNGAPSPVDIPFGPFNTLNAMGLEALTLSANQILRDRLNSLGIGAVYDFYNGIHNWPHWQEALVRARPMILDSLGAR